MKKSSHTKKIVHFPRKRKSPTVTPEMAADIKRLLEMGMHQHDVAAKFGVNQGRVSEINTGIKYPGVSPTQGDLFL